MPSLPPIPQVELDVVCVTDAQPPGFLTLKRWDLVIVSAGKRTKPFRYDTVERASLDASVMVAHSVGGNDVLEVYLRSAIRPPVGLRADGSRAQTVLWELPAGLIDEGETPRDAAVRELAEELGFHVAADEMKPLGPWAYPAPGFIAEMHHFFHVRVDPSQIRAPAGDGSPLEEGAAIVKVPLVDALDACRSGVIRDEKTELALNRLAHELGRA